MISFYPLIKQITPRILTQVCRDPSSANFGCFDRNWWHYKMRDFPSVILQQGGYYLYFLKGFPEFNEYEKGINDIVKATINFWSERAIKKGAFEEYYPWEKGYPPLAFSTLAIAKLIKSTNYSDLKIRRALKKASVQLLTRFENRAANQQVAGIAALAVINSIYPEFVDKARFNSLSEKTLKLQDDEGWFMEYDGPDLGYLSVTLDCLWDLYDFTSEQIFYEAARRAFSFLATFVTHFHGSIGMHNSRNTDYIVPYGLTRFLLSERSVDKALAARVLNYLYFNLSDENHFLHAIDDRYWIHYIGHSVLRAEIVIRNLEKTQLSYNRKINKQNTKPVIFYKNAGYLLKEEKTYQLLISCLKGGIFTLRRGEMWYSDFGWILRRKNISYVAHWWNPQLVIVNKCDSINIKGFLIPHKEMNSTPCKHIILRIASYFLGSVIITYLKDSLIFKSFKSRYGFERTISFSAGRIKVKDTIYNLKGNEEILTAPRTSKRHVASADSFHPEDFLTNQYFKIIRKNFVEVKSFSSELIIEDLE